MTETVSPLAEVGSIDPLSMGEDLSLRKALLHASYDHLMASQLAAILIVSVLFYSYWDLVELQLGSGWLAYMLLVSVARIALSQFFDRDQEQELAGKIKIWWGLNFFGVFLSALGWGWAGILFYTPGDLVHELLLIGVIAGISAGAVLTLAASMLSLSTFLAISITPLAYSHLISGEATEALGFLIFVYLVMLLVIGRRSHMNLRRLITLQINNASLIDELTRRADELENWQSLALTEQEMALSVYQSIMSLEKLSLSNVTFHLSSHSAFNGDILLIEPRPDGTQILMLGDFTGHGLSASLGAIPVADIFRSMTHKGFAIEKVVSEINNKIYTQLPENIFLAACVAEIDAGRSRMRVWNAGLPSVYLLHGHDGTIKQRIDSLSPPLGIIPSSQLGVRSQTLQINDQDQLFMATDGVTEQRNASGEMFGDERLEKVLNSIKDINDLTIALQVEIAVFCEGVSQGDDLTFVVARAEKGTSQKRPTSLSDEVAKQPSHWGLKVRLDADAMRSINPVPVLNHLIQEFNNHNPELKHFELALGELYKNALDHGVLGLDSSLKQTPEGYLSYYEGRDNLLDALEKGRIEIEINNASNSAGGSIELRVTDSGTGFDYLNQAANIDNLDDAHGRGVALVRSLCKELNFEGRGNQVRALYHWSYGQAEK